MAEPNQAAWNSRWVARDFVGKNDLFGAEQVVLADLTTALRGRPVLDLGVGGGRTTPHLLALSDRYVGLDYSGEMVAKARASNPTADIRQGDARDLSAFPDASFAFVLFAFNGIDYVPYEDRALILREVYRVLEPGGHFAFSTHNLRWLGDRRQGVFRVQRIGISPNPLRSGVRLARWARHTARGYAAYRRLRSSETVGDDYAVVNDGACDYSLLTCHVEARVQCDELERTGFAEPRLFEIDARPASVDSTGPWLYYLVKKPAERWRSSESP